jgi:integrase
MARRMKGLYKRGKVWWCAYKSLYGDMKRESTKTSDYNEAIDYLTDRKAEIKAGTEPETKKIVNHTFWELVEEYKKWCERQRGFKSKIYFIKQLEDEFGYMLLRNFSTMLVEQYQTKKMNKGNKPATINRHVACLKHMMTKANDWNMVEETVVGRVRKVKMFKENNKRVRYLSKDEWQTLLEVCDSHLYPIVLMALNTGMRKSEILNLQWDDIDLANNFIHLEITKNGERRDIPINETLKEMLVKLPRRLDGKYLFYDPKTQKPFKDVKRSYKTACKNASITNFHFHDLRHTFASHLVMIGVDLTTVKELLGHKSLAMTLRYAHLSPEHKTKAVNVLDGMFKQSPMKKSEVS